MDVNEFNVPALFKFFKTLKCECEKHNTCSSCIFFCNEHNSRCRIKEITGTIPEAITYPNVIDCVSLNTTLNKRQYISQNKKKRRKKNGNFV